MSELQRRVRALQSQPEGLEPNMLPDGIVSHLCRMTTRRFLRFAGDILDPSGGVYER